MRRIDEISNLVVRAVLLDPCQMARSAFHHRYEGGQCDWGVVTMYGVWAWFGGDEPEQVEFIEDLDVFDEIMIEDIDLEG